MVYFVIALFAFFISKPLDDNMGIAAVKFVPILVLLVGIVRYTFYRKGHVFVGRIVNRKEMLWYSLFILVYIVSIFRKYEAEMMSIGTINQSLQVFFVASFGYAFFSYMLRQPGLHEENFTKIIKILLIPPALFIMLNAISYVMGFTASLDEQYVAGKHTHSVLAGLLGLSIKRTGFMFTGHPNNFAPVVGLIVVLSVMALYSLQLSRNMRWFLYVSIFFSLFAIILADSRGTFVSMTVSLSIIFFLKNLNKLNFTRVVVYILPIIPFVITFVLAFVSQSGLGEGMSRDANEVATANGRVYIWEQCIAFIQDPEIQHIFGYGQVGHQASGVAKLWAWKLPDFVAHNFFFQVFLDQGYLGITLMLGLLFLAVNNALFLYRRGHKSMLVFMVFPVFYLFSGLFESIFGVYNQFYTTMYILLTLCPILFKNAYLKGQDGYVQVPLVTLETQT